MCGLDVPGRYPWPVTTSGEGTDATLWVRSGVSPTMERAITANGVQVHDLPAAPRREGATLENGAPDHAAIVVARPR